jgi:hypothetical protein
MARLTEALVDSLEATGRDRFIFDDRLAGFASGSPQLAPRSSLPRRGSEAANGASRSATTLP